MAQFRIFLIGCSAPQVVALPAASINQVSLLVAGGRFLTGELVDVVDEDGALTNRPALIPVSRIHMIVEDHQ
jgi:kynureninase